MMKVRVGIGLTVMSLLMAGHCLCQERPKITGVSHLSVYTSDAAKAETFYVHDLGGFKGVDPQNPLGVRYYFNAIQFVEVLPLPEGPESKNRFDHAGYNTTNADGLRKYLGAHDVAVPAAATKGSDGSQYFEVKDPEGNRVQFVQPPAHPLSVPVNPLSSHMIHVGYIVHDIAKEDTFYRGHFGVSALLAWWCDGGFARLDFAASAGWHRLGGVHEGEGAGDDRDFGRYVATDRGGS